MTLRESIGYRCQHAFANSRGHRATLQGSFVRPFSFACAEALRGSLLRNQAVLCLRKHPERRAAAVMSPSPAARSRRALPLTSRAQASFDCAHRRLRADALRSGCLRS